VTESSDRKPYRREFGQKLSDDAVVRVPLVFIGDTKVSEKKLTGKLLVADIVGKQIATLEDVYADVNVATDGLSVANKAASAERRTIMDNCAALALTHNFTAEEIKLGVEAAITSYKGNALAQKTLDNLKSELKSVMHPNVRAKLPELRKLAKSVIADKTRYADLADAFSGREDFIVARVAADAAKARHDLKEPPVTVEGLRSLVTKRDTARSQSIPRVKGKLKMMITICNEAEAILRLPQFAKIRVLCEALNDDATLKAALAKHITETKNASNLRGANGKEKAAPAEGASDMDDVLNDAA
jgi:hypothetical protein